jgi:hypothetical protein
MLALLVPILALPGIASAQLAPPARCQNLAASIVLTMKTYREVGQTREVALEQTGFSRGTPRYTVADGAYRRLESGANTDTVLAWARQECLRIGPDALEDDEGDEDAGGSDGMAAGDDELPVCADAASSIAALLTDDPTLRRGPVDDALLALRSSDPRDIPTPQLRRLLERALDPARRSLDAPGLQRAVYGDCDALDPAVKARLRQEFYVP